MTRKDALMRRTSWLIARRDALRRSISGDVESFRKASEPSGVGDQADAAVDLANEELTSQLAALESRELGQIEHALDRIGMGTYGSCEFCGGKIGASRLNALPYAASCIDCQRATEGREHSTRLEPESNRWDRVFDDSMAERENESPVDLVDFGAIFRESGCQALASLIA
jgi:DnaK suppressor protein